MTYKPIQLTAEQLERYHTDGFLILEQFLPQDLTQRLAQRMEPLFRGEFETSIYPDEWHWRPQLSRNDVTREMCNAWKSDLTIASLALSAEIGRLAATLSGWSGARIGQDSMWVKPPGAREIAMHQDGAYVDYIDPPQMITCWISLDDATVADGTLIYAKGSHQWELVNPELEFHAPSQDFRLDMLKAAAQAGVSAPELVAVEIPAGGCAFHHGRTWHALGKTTRSDRYFHSIGLHLIPAAARFHPVNKPGYIYGRYKRVGSLEMDENFFPILWTTDGYRTPFLKDYCQDALVRSEAVGGTLTAAF
jgi:phytanoyl-CoA hydroxylase